MFIKTKAIFKFSAIPIKIPMAVFTETEQTILQLLWNHKKTQIAKPILGKKKVGGITGQNFKATVIKTVQYWHKTRHTDQWKRIKTPETHSCIYGQLI